MKKIEAIIRPECIDAVKRALQSTGHGGITVLAAQGHGIQGGVRQKWRLKEYVVDLIPKALVMVVVHDHQLEDALDAIAHAARTDRIGDGKIFVTEVADVMRVRTGERGADAM